MEVKLHQNDWGNPGVLDREEVIAHSIVYWPRYAGSISVRIMRYFAI